MVYLLENKLSDFNIFFDLMNKGITENRDPGP